MCAGCISDGQGCLQVEGIPVESRMTVWLAFFFFLFCPRSGDRINGRFYVSTVSISIIINIISSVFTPIVRIFTLVGLLVTVIIIVVVILCLFLPIYEAIKFKTAIHSDPPVALYGRQAEWRRGRRENRE